MKGNLYQHIKIRHAYDFSLCFPHELLEFLKYYLKHEQQCFIRYKDGLIKHALRMF
jgi:hypothetical protein